MSNNPFTTNTNGSNNPFNSFMNKTTTFLSDKSNQNPSTEMNTTNNNSSNVFSTKNLATNLISNKNPFPIISNDNNKDDNQAYQINTTNSLFPSNIKNDLLNETSLNATQGNQGVNTNPVASGNLLDQNKDSSKNLFNKQFSFSGNDGKSNYLLGNQQKILNSNVFGNMNDINSYLTNPKNTDNKDNKNKITNVLEDKNTQNPLFIQENKNNIHSNNIDNVNRNLSEVNNDSNRLKFFNNQDNHNKFSKLNTINKELQKDENTSFASVDKKISNTDNNVITNRQIGIKNESNNNKLMSLGNEEKSNPTRIDKNKILDNQKEMLKCNDIDIKKPTEQIKESRTIEEFKIDKLMSLSIDDLINKWKLELDNQVEKFEKAADSIKNFELNFQNQYDKVGHLTELINKITENGENTLSELTNISKEEDYIIDQLDCMERNLDKFFDIVSKNNNINEKGLSVDDKIYSSAIELDSNVKEIQREIDTIHNNFNNQSEYHAKKVENLKSFHDKNSGISFDVMNII